MMTYDYIYDSPGTDMIGSSKVGSIKATFEDLVEFFGVPRSSPYDDGKSTYEWRFTAVRGDEELPFTIYDWKEAEIVKGKVYEWSIGGFSRDAAGIALDHFFDNFIKGRDL